jgi:hypothetical protein
VRRARLVQIDGKLPNLALMGLSRWLKAEGWDVTFTRSVRRDLFEPAYDAVYGSAIFAYSAERIATLRAEFPGAVVGGTGTGDALTVEQAVGAELGGLDYSLYPEFRPSLGFTQRGCRLSCKFCVVPWKEGKPRAVASVADIWRGPPYPKRLHLLDNDFFGQPEAEWRARIGEIASGGFKVCFNQGINVRAITDETAAAVAAVQYRDDEFRERRLYTAWDNLKDERVFFEGVERLEKAGVPAKHLRAYMLVGWTKGETMERIMQRFERMVAAGIEPYPMVYDMRAADPGRYRLLKQFQRWAVTGLYRAFPFAAYDAGAKAARRPAAGFQESLFAGKVAA